MFPHRLSAAAPSTAHRVRLVPAAAYTVVVLVVSAVVLAAVLFSDDPGFIGVWLIFVTAPLASWSAVPGRTCCACSPTPPPPPG
ncbi:SCO4225 family membrane protein [Actinomadura sp. 3N407]|uniref:SCO4225 family membrane protein n=1 Tax=Actinomadura sp. 3N407 TaxID=3457423 RepID=UPI003FCCBE7B